MPDRRRTHGCPGATTTVSVSDPARLAAARAMRRQRVTALRPAPEEPEVQVRPLADYDSAFGTGGGVA